MKHKAWAIGIFVIVIVLLGLRLEITNDITGGRIRIGSFDIKQLQEYQTMRQEIYSNIIIPNDYDEDVVFEYEQNGKMFIFPCAWGNAPLVNMQGHVRIFVPRKKGWYTVTYPYPYPLTQLYSGIGFVAQKVTVSVATLIDSVDKDGIKVFIGNRGDTQVVRDIKVAFKPGELTGEMKKLLLNKEPIPKFLQFYRKP